ncbi:prenyltransferase/squalene oxidase repeat-containing protein [Ruminococcus sp.]|uniref:prenyltransferase/squalene oxidase repeat-containing protein n=1 Tax=Ruminococcus sp. TaxID=41978 RepID=UPI00258D9262|nr:prenyltransferase/squalene oxidase repeat-containing protein [Ruminococcus sp.]MCR5020958.1 terpene cyclase/mutase family protein [Ruminococcus sp.]
MLKRLAALSAAAVMLLVPVSASALETGQAEGYARGIITFEKNKNGIPEKDSLLSGSIAEDAGFDSSDWLAIGAVRAGLEDDTAEYRAAWEKRIQEDYSDEKSIGKIVPTDWHRAVLTGLCLGADPADVSGVDLLGCGTYLRGENRSLDKQGLNAWIWGLIAVDSCDWKMPEEADPDRKDMIDTIISAQNSDGGYSLTAGDGRSDIDITAMALQALSPYRNCEEAEGTIAAALGYLAENKSSADNCESTAQMICALCCLDIDPDTDERFAGLTDAMISFANDDGGFAHKKGESSSELASSQALIALCSLQRLRSGERSVYDMNEGSAVKPQRTTLDAMAAAKNRNTTAPAVKKSSAKVKKVTASVSAVIAVFGIAAVSGGILMRRRKEKNR